MGAEADDAKRRPVERHPHAGLVKLARADSRVVGGNILRGRQHEAERVLRHRHVERTGVAGDCDARWEPIEGQVVDPRQERLNHPEAGHRPPRVRREGPGKPRHEDDVNAGQGGPEIRVREIGPHEDFRPPAQDAGRDLPMSLGRRLGGSRARTHVDHEEHGGHGG